MTSSAETTGRRAASEAVHLLVVEDIPVHGDEVAELLAARGYRMSRAATAAEALTTLARDRPSLVILIDHDEPGVERGPGRRVRAAAGDAGVPTLVVVEDLGDPAALAARLGDADDWVSIAGAASELPVRVARLLERRHSGAGGSVFGPRFLSLVVHDLRTPLNVIGLSLRIISQAVPREDPEIQEDLRFVDENFQLLVRMLHQLSDFHRLHDLQVALDPVAFDPRRFVDDLLAEVGEKSRAKAPALRLEVDPSCPPEVSLDQVRAKLAIQYAVTNAAAASRDGGVVTVRLSGRPDRWVTEVHLDQPAPATVQTLALSPALFERICGSEAERRGMDLAIAARISALFGGDARLEVRPGGGTAVVLDWPTSLAPSERAHGTALAP